MRYYKGHISITLDRDIPLLLLVRDARAIRSAQLYEMLLLTSVETSRSSARWRMCRLARVGLLCAVEDKRFIGEPIYSITRNGLAMLESHGHSLLSVGSFSKTIAPQSRSGSHDRVE